MRLAFKIPLAPAPVLQLDLLLNLPFLHLQTINLASVNDERGKCSLRFGKWKLNDSWDD